MKMSKLEIKNLSKNFGKVCALDDVSVTFEEGKIYGLLGRNGAGKSTLLNSITGVVYPDSGSIMMDGKSVIENDKALGKIYKTSEKTYYPDAMKVKELFKVTKYFYPDFDMDYALSISKQFGLDIGKKVKGLSTGFTSILKQVIALSVNTPFVFFDEPVLGLDANNRDLFYRLLIEKFSEKPFCAVVSTHLIEEISTIVESVIIVKNGKIIRNTTCEELLQQGYTVSGSAKAVEEYIKGKSVIGTDSLGGLKTAYIIGKAESEPQNGLEFTKLDLQKLFVKLTDE